jgi:nicotinate-nucleotide adenylyltransferase
MNVALFGGTFNPIHNTHLFIANDIAAEYRLDKVIFIPDNKPPHKDMEYNLPGETRLRMSALAIEGNPRFGLSDIEIKRGGVSYTYDTVKHIKSEYGIKHTLYFIMGADLLPELNRWHKISELKNEVHFIVFNRKEIDIKKYLADYPHISEFKGMKSELSSSLIRARIRENKSIKYLLPEKVEKYILDNSLYRA